jgi:transcription antitermination factor NusA-like protein
MALSHNDIRTHLCALLKVNPEQVSFKHDDSNGAERVEILFRDSQIDWALRDNGRFVRQAAMDLGIDIEVGSA